MKEETLKSLNVIKIVKFKEVNFTCPVYYQKKKVKVLDSVEVKRKKRKMKKNHHHGLLFNFNIIIYNYIK